MNLYRILVSKQPSFHLGPQDLLQLIILTYSCLWFPNCCKLVWKYELTITKFCLQNKRESITFKNRYLTYRYSKVFAALKTKMQFSLLCYNSNYILMLCLCWTFCGPLFRKKYWVCLYWSLCYTFNAATQ